jgi:hypothetical protein
MTSSDKTPAGEHPLRHGHAVRRPKRVAVVNDHALPMIEKRGKSPQMVNTPWATSVHVPHRPATFPPAWSYEMRAETTAAFLRAT